MKKIIMIGAGGYAKSVLDTLDDNDCIVVGFLDNYKVMDEHLGYPLLGCRIQDIADYQQYEYFISIGNNNARKHWYEQLVQYGCDIATVIDKTAIVSAHAQIGKGCFVGKMAIVNSRVIVDDNSIINTKALVEHGCHIEKHSNISTNTVLNGDVVAGEGCFIGSSAVVRGQLRVGAWSIVGAGAVVVKDVPDGKTVVGIPAHELDHEEK